MVFFGWNYMAFSFKNDRNSISKTSQIKSGWSSNQQESKLKNKTIPASLCATKLAD